MAACRFSEATDEVASRPETTSCRKVGVCMAAAWMAVWLVWLGKSKRISWGPVLKGNVRRGGRSPERPEEEERDFEAAALVAPAMALYRQRNVGGEEREREMIISANRRLL